MEILPAILVWRSIKGFQRAATHYGLSMDHFQDHLVGFKVGRSSYWGLRIKRKPPTDTEPDCLFIAPPQWADNCSFIFLENVEGRPRTYMEPAICAEDADLAISEALHGMIQNDALPLYTGPMISRSFLEKQDKKKPRNGSRASATGDNHYAAGHEKTVQKMNDDFCKKANGLHRLEVAIIKYLDGVDHETIRAALNQTRAAQEDTDFHALWKLFDDKARAVNAGSDKV